MLNRPDRVLAGFAISFVGAVVAVSSGFVSQAEFTEYHWSRGVAPGLPAPSVRLLDSSSQMSPLLLSAHRADRLEIDWSCDLAGSLSRSLSTSLMVATTAEPSTGGIRLEAVDSANYQLTSGGRVIARVPVFSSSDEPGCAYGLDLDRSGAFAVHRGRDLVTAGTIDPPVVTSISTGLQPGSIAEGFVAVDVQTRPHGPSQSALRTGLRVVAAAMLGLAAYLLLNRKRDPLRPRQDGTEKRLLGDKKSWIDSIVIVILLTWWLVGPIEFDDGWITSIVRNFDSDGVFASYYDARNGAAPLGYVHFFTIRAIAALSLELVWLRLPSLIFGVVGWFLTKSLVEGAVRGAGWSRSSLTVRIATASMFALSWVSWNNTVRAEPMVAVLAALTVWAAVRFISSLHPGFLLVGTVAAAFAVSIHPTGLVALAPLLAAVPGTWRWARSEPTRAVGRIAGIGLLAIGVGALALWSVGDVRFWLDSRALFVEGGHNLGFADEPVRYTYLFTDGTYSNSVRTLSVLIPLVAVALFLVRRTRTRTVADVPVIAFVLSSVLLAFGPSKWIWHFGVLAPVAAAAVGVELQRLASERAEASKVIPGIGVAALGTLAITTVSWRQGFQWHEVALIRWIDDQSPPQVVGRLLANPGVLVLGVGLLWGIAAMRQRPRAPGSHAMRRANDGVVLWLVPATASVAVILAITTFVVDGLVLAPGWSLAGQNASTVFGSSCGLGEDLDLPATGQSLSELIEARGGPILMAPQIAPYFPCISQPVIDDGVAEIPTVILSVGVVPLGFGGSPYRYLSDIAEFRELDTAQTSTGQQLPITVTLVNPVTTDDADG